MVRIVSTCILLKLFMKFSSHTTRWIARLILGLALFAQGVLTANACDGLHASATQAFAAKAADMAGMPCHDEDSPNANACLAHCTQGDQVNVDQLSPAFIPARVVALVAVVPASSVVLTSYFTSRILLNTGPPVSIRFCSFQI